MFSKDPSAASVIDAFLTAASPSTLPSDSLRFVPAVAPTVAFASMPPSFVTLLAGNALPDPSMSAAAIFALERICVVPIFCKDPSVARVML